LFEKVPPYGDGNSGFVRASFLDTQKPEKCFSLRACRREKQIEIEFASVMQIYKKLSKGIIYDNY